MMSWVLSPYALLQQGLGSALLPDEYNIIKRAPGKVPRKVMRLSKDISRSDFQTRCRQVRCSVNEATLSLIGVSLKEYAVRHGDHKLDAITICSTFVMKPFPTKAEEIEWGNNWVPQYYKIPVNDSIDECIKENKRSFRELIGSIKLLGMQNFTNLMTLLPFNLAKLAIGQLSKKLSMTYSNMPGPENNMTFNNSKLNWLSAYLPAVGEMLCGMVAISQGKIMKVNLITDL